MSLMIGCHAAARSTEIAIDKTELEDARWFDRAEVAQMLMRKHRERFATPPPVAIAYHLIRAWVEDEVAACPGPSVAVAEDSRS
jgi:NAD+ diphosphatase